MRRYLSLLFTLAVIAVNAAANILPINGVNTGEISARYPTGFTPAGWVFSIWGLIYAGLAAFSIHAARTRDTSRLAGIEPAYWLSCIANGLWIFMWHYGRILESLVLMLVILVCLIFIYVRLRSTSPPASLAERLCMDAPFSLYFGWITTAALANLAAWFFALNTWPFGLPMDDWALLTVVTATAVYTAMGVRTQDAIYTGVFLWASLGIILQTIEISAPVRLAAAAGCAVMLVVTVVSVRSASTRRSHAS